MKTLQLNAPINNIFHVYDKQKHREHVFNNPNSQHLAVYVDSLTTICSAHKCIIIRLFPRLLHMVLVGFIVLCSIRARRNALLIRTVCR